MAQSPRRIQASSFELVDHAGRVRAALELGSNEHPRLRLLDEKAATIVELGIRNTVASLIINGVDRRPRVTIVVPEDGGPTLRLGDDRWEERVVLGAIHPDMADRKADSWGLLFGDPVSRVVFAGIGMNTPRDLNRHVGSLFIRDTRGSRWDAPLSQK